MNALFVVAAVALLAVVCADGDQDSAVLFKNFVEKYGRKYADDVEYNQRFVIFKQNLAEIARLNSEGNPVFGIGPFTDLTPEEFKATHLNYRPQKVAPSEPISVYSPPVGVTAPSSFDWRTKGAVTKVKDQGNCGSCWAFSTVEEVESMWQLAGNPLVELSPQQVVSCDKKNGDLGCAGGDTVIAYKYVQSSGLETEAAYPYTSGNSGQDGTCKFDAKKVVAKISGFTYAVPPCTDSCTKQNETALELALATKGPVSICVYAATWQFYAGGVFKSKCTSTYSSLDHCVQLVGYDKTGNYWLVRNSWATSWGISGYMQLEMGKNLCGVADEATFVTI